jgi:two-component system sensor histidine kinase SenX3
VSLKDVAALAVARYEKVAEAKAMTIKTKVTGKKAMGDQESLVELMAILIDNAIKYSSSGTTVNINDGRRGKMVYFMVSDKGMGISPKDLPRVFDRFYQAESSRNKQAAAGYGLGLAIAKRIADAHKGHINVTSTLGKGTSFTVYLPAA